MIAFNGFPKISRLSRDVVVTEKIDGTNAQIFIEYSSLLPDDEDRFITVKDGLLLFAGCRSRWITPKDDNFGFARWVETNADELFKLGPGSHFGEWWGSGIQRGYGLTKGEKRFSLFNTARWSDDLVRPTCCHVVPVLGQHTFDTGFIQTCLDNLRTGGSVASPGFPNPEGVVIFHTASRQLFKKTLDKDAEPKSVANGG